MKIKSEHIRIIAGTVIVMTALVALFLYVSQKEFRQPPPNDIPLLSTTTLKGYIAGYGSNPDRDIDKLLLKNGDEEEWLHFAPNTAADVLSVAKPGEFVEVSVRDDRKPAPDGVEQEELVSVTNTGRGKTLTLQHTPPPPPAEGRKITVSGNILRFVTDSRGTVRSVVVDRWLISLPPHARDALMPLLVKDSKITIKGWERSRDAGFVNEDSLTVIRPYAVLIDGTQYSIQ